MIDISVRRSPGFWFNRLAVNLLARRSRYENLDSYISDEIAAPALCAKATREAYSRLRSMASLNFAELIVEAPRERMRPVGFMTGAEGDENGDNEAWKIWQANHLDADSAVVHRTALTLGDAYVIVGPVDEQTGFPLITVEDPREVIVECDPNHHRRPIAALKMYHDSIDGRDVAYLYLPGEVWRASSDRPSYTFEGAGSISNFTATEWTWDSEVPQILPAKVIPVVRFVNKPDLRAAGVGEFERHRSILDRINYQILQRLEIATLQAFRQRAVKGMPNTDALGNEIDYADVFASDPGALWLLPETAEMWESGQVDLTPVLLAIRDDVQHLAAVTRTPLFYLSPEASSGSAEGASLAREGLVFKTTDRLAQAGESWEQVMALAFGFAGDAVRARLGDMQVMWESPERHSLAEKYDAATKAQAVGVPTSTIWRSILGFSPQEVARMEADRILDSMLAPAAPDAVMPVPGAVMPAAAPQVMTPQDMAAAATALGVLIRAGVTPDVAAASVGLDDLTFTGAVPVSLRLPEDDAANLEGA